MRSPNPVEKPSCTSLGARVAMAAARAVGIDTTRAVSVALEFPEPGVTLLAVKFHVDDAALERVLEAVRTIPLAE